MDELNDRLDELGREIDSLIDTIEDRLEGMVRDTVWSLEGKVNAADLQNDRALHDLMVP
jgi:hypothetical protein